MSDVEEKFEDKTDDELDADGSKPLDVDDEELGEDEEMEDLEEDEDLNDMDEETRNEMKVVEEVLSQKEQNARSLAIRRAIERRAEEKQFHDDVDYLDD
jgi:hypothetical protein